MTSIIDATSDGGFESSAAADERGGGGACHKLVSIHATGTAQVMVWKADAGTGIVRGPPHAEPFVVLKGTAQILVGKDAPADIRPAAIVHMPLHAGMALEAKTALRMMSTVIMEHAR